MTKIDESAYLELFPFKMYPVSLKHLVFQYKNYILIKIKVPQTLRRDMAYYITWPDLLLVEFQLGMMHALLILKILMMNWYYRLMVCANIWKFFREYWRKYGHFAFWLKIGIT